MKLRNKIIIGLLWCLFCLINPAVGYGDDVYSENDFGFPNIIIAEGRWVPIFKAGESSVLSIPLNNTGTGNARDVLVTITSGDSANLNIASDKMTLTKHSNSLGSRQSAVYDFNILIPPYTKPGTYPINVSVAYNNASGGGGSAAGTIYIKVENENLKPELRLLGVDFPVERMPVDEVFNIIIKLQNSGAYPLNNVTAKLEGFAPNTINLKGSKGEYLFTGVNSGEEISLNFDLIADAELASGVYPLDLKATFNDDNYAEHNKDFKIYIPIDGKGTSNDKLSPRVIISNYSFGGEFVEPGIAFPLQISFKNTGGTKVRNVKISLNAEDQVFSPVGGSNTVYIDTIEPGGISEQNLTFKAKIDAENENKIINADIGYQDEKGNKFEEKEIISIPIQQPTKLVISSLEIPPQAFAQMQTNISIDFYNSGRGIIRNIIISSEGNFEAQPRTAYIGNLESGKDDYFDITITPDSEGLIEGKVILQYEDIAGVAYTLEEPFSLEVLPMMGPMGPMGYEMGMEGMGENGMENTASSSFLAYGAFGLGGLMVLTITWLLVRRRRRIKREIELDE